MKVADFFCGAGGFSEGFRQKGFEVVFALDSWKPAIETHKLNHPRCRHALIDILGLDTPKKIDEVVPDTEVMIGSPPCVSFSHSNKAGKADKSLGLRLIEAYLRIVAWKRGKGKVKYWLLENVPNSGRYMKGRYTWKELGLPGKGPDLIIKRRGVYNSADYGVPQTRKRFICGDYPVPKKTHQGRWVTMEDVLGKLGDPLKGNGEKRIEDPVYGFQLRKEKVTDHFYDTRVARFEWERAKRLKKDHGYMGRMDFPENLKRPSRTVMATRSASTREAMLFGVKDDGFRLPTIREIACFMSFPLKYQFEAVSEESKYRLVGNAVPCRMAAAFAQAMLEKDGMETVPDYMPLKPSHLCSVDLTGTERRIRGKAMRRPDARFAMHVPYLKIRAMRVELTNKESDFSKNRIRWLCKLYRGSGKTHLKLDTDNKDVEMLLSQEKGSEAFKRDVLKEFRGLRHTPVSLQEEYARDGPESPPALLERIRGLVDKHYPAEGFKDKEVGNIGLVLPISSRTVPLRIVAALYACNHLVGRISKA